MSYRELVVTYIAGHPAIAYLYLCSVSSDAKVAHTREVRRGLLVDFTADGKPYGLEIINPGVNTPEELLDLLAEVGATEVTLADLAPLSNAAKYAPVRPERPATGTTRASAKANKRRRQSTEPEPE